MRKTAVSGVIVLAMLLVALPSLASSSQWGRLAGTALRAAESRSDGARVVARINSEVVAVKGLLLSKAMLQAAALQQGKSPDAVTNAQAFALQKEIAVQIAEAKRRGITVTDQEGRAMAKQVHETYQQDTSPSKAQIADFIKAQGLTEEQYWSEYAPKAYKETLYITRLRQQIYDSAEGTPQAKMEAYDRFLATLIQSAKVEVLEPDWAK